ncbi:hypothetical protein IMSAGC011_02419 [Lachnospiraceae bacterium]|nr:hypothetical protein IMSAGC011_02419 [Lachnospiraceae bacterium]
MHRIGGVLFGVLCIGMFGSLLVACNGRRKLDESSLQQVPQFIEIESSSEEVRSAIELIALSKDQEEAEKIAELYGIELSSFSDGIAVYTTDKDPQELMELGDNNGYPALTVNSNHYQLKKISEVTDTNQ